MEKVKLQETEVLETNNVFDFADGQVRVFEREVHEFYRPERGVTPRLIVEDAIERTKSFISKTRAEFADLNSLMAELRVR